ncbi:hypothetical protein AMECASPLE_005426 [Ameca splendens]|uniref:Uncharacterized protein n=1 Tax=Ameca splendens TaxID=208324 RepID=A0ABV0XC67_9TELE
MPFLSSVLLCSFQHSMFCSPSPSPFFSAHFETPLKQVTASSNSLLMDLLGGSTVQIMKPSKSTVSKIFIISERLESCELLLQLKQLLEMPTSWVSFLLGFIPT